MQCHLRQDIASHEKIHIDTLCGFEADITGRAEFRFAMAQGAGLGVVAFCDGLGLGKGRV